MKATAIYFSPTGNTKKTAEAMAAAVDPAYERMDLTLPAENDGLIEERKRIFGKEELVILGMPVYGGRIPPLAVERLTGLKGEGTPCVLVACYGNRHYDDALVEMEDIMKEKGFAVRAAAAVVGRHTYGAIQVDRPDTKDLEEDTAFMRNVLERIEQNASLSTLPGSRPYQKESMKNGHFQPSVTEGCMECGRCRKECPAGAIDEALRVDEKLCLSCFRCVRNCPTGAMRMQTPEYEQFAEDFTRKLAVRRENEYFF